MFYLNQSNNILSNHPELITCSDKEKLLSQKGLVIWMTGYSGSGKTTLAYELEKRLYEKGFLTKVLDGDILRQGINKGLGFNTEDRTENVRRTAELAKQLCSCGVVVICSLITPTNYLRDLAKNIIGENQFILYHISTPIDICEQRDVKGHYAKARSGELKEFTGVSNPFEKPANFAYSIDTSKLSIAECVLLMYNNIIPLIAF